MLLAHITEERQLAPLVARNLAIAPAEQDMRLDADRAQLLDRVLGRLGLELAGGRNERQQREMNEDDMAAWQIVAELADQPSKNGSPSMSPTVPADLDQDEVDAVVALEDEVLDRVGDVRDHLHRRAEEVPAPLLGDQLLIDAARGDVVLPVGAPPAR